MTALTTPAAGDRPASAAAPGGPALPGAFVAPMSHLDLTFMGPVEECLSRGGKVFAGVLRLLDEQLEFRFFLEYVLFLEAYRAARPAEAARLDEHIRAGRIELGAEWSGIFAAQDDEEDLVRNVLYAKRYARERHGIELETLQLSDIPGVIPQLPQVCAGLGIRNLVLTRCAPPDTLFWYEAPGGESRVLVWSADGYGEASRYGIHLGADAMRERGLAERLAATRAGVPPLFYWGTDLYLPPPGLVPAVRAWNAATASGADGQPGTSALEVITPTAYFRRLREAGVAEQAPVLRGELPSTWLYGEPDHAHVTRWDGPATRALDAAERFCTLAWLRLGREYPRAELETLWKTLLLTRDHNFGGKGAGGGQPRKLADRRMVAHRADLLLHGALASIAEQVEAPAESVPIVVFNALNWERTDVVRAHVTYYPGVDPGQRDLLPRGVDFVLRAPDGAAVPYQITADRRETLGEFDLAFVARDVPGLGYAAYTLEPAPAAAAAHQHGAPRVPGRVWFGTEPADLVLDNGRVRLVVDRTSGQAHVASSPGAVPLNTGGSGSAAPVPVGGARPAATAQPGQRAPLVANLRLQGREELPEVRLSPPRALSFDDPARETVVAFQPAADPVQLVCEGPVVATARVAGSVLGVPAEVLYSVFREQPFVEVEVRLDWDLRRFGRVELAYDVPVPGAAAAYGLPFGAGAYGAEHLLPSAGPVRGDEAARESWERTREIARWLDVAGPAGGVAMATDHRWTRVDPLGEPAQGLAVRCCLVRGGRMRAAEPAMDGDDPRLRLVYRFRLQPHAGTWQEAQIARAGWAAVQPLLAYTVNDTWSPKSLPRRQALATLDAHGDGDAFVTCLKQAEDGEDIVARWYEGTGRPCQVQIGVGPGAGQPGRADLQEQPLDPASGSPAGETAPWEIVTVRTAVRPAGSAGPPAPAGLPVSRA